ncbi:TetR family transcriptional regulator [Streptomyces sp. 150FB]|uniref:TetR/AcrR family transcriptional regulator n=1 Tax=Streptomyces sp. 150FB TaxID=1576605 RepID=UPI00058950B9|nr:TetR/AcrR family transcriptional regulator [Streptomyces sp. 150FB]KIF78941.1 TetR family transcriptional regulator [Streptomyces sp. 150FB]
MARGLTARGAATRQRIIEGAASLMREVGPVRNLDEILTATSTSKSQLFHYFPSGRPDLLTAVARYEADQTLAAQQPYLMDLTSWRKWESWRKVLVAHYAELGERCPLGALTAQLGKSSPETRDIVTELYDTWETYLRTGTRALAERGKLAAGLSPDEVARGILTAIQGGVVMLRATGRTSYLETGLKQAMFPLRPAATRTAAR